MWSPVVSGNTYGQFAVFARAPGHPSKEVTYFRGVPLKLQSYSYGDPFSDAIAEIVFPQITPFDDPTSPALWFINEWTHYDIYWVPATGTQTSSRDVQVIHPKTQKKTLWLNYASKGDPIWEGFSVSYTPSDQGMQIQLQGALYQLDRYLAKPFYPNRPVVMERLIKKLFNPNRRKLETKRLKYVWPDGWTKTFPTDDPRTPYTPKGVDPGDNWTGMATRSTGTWDRALTGFIQDLLSQMYTDEDSGVDAGNQWTIRKYPGRQPKLEVRDRFRVPDFEIWYGTPGVDVSLTRDGMSTVNIIYGQGTSFDGVPWSRARYLNDGKYTDYTPAAFDPHYYPYEDEAVKKKEGMPSETLIKFGNGVGEDQGVSASQKMLMRDMDPGWTGEITLKTDVDGYIKWKIVAGMTLLLKGWAGNMEGVRLHISEAIHSPEAGTVQLRVDTRYRDLLTLEQVQATVRDPLTPVKMLQVNKRTLLIEDILVPWDYNASGMIPIGSKKFFNNLEEYATFPWEKWTKKFPPKDNEEFYIRSNANANDSKNRWAAKKVLLSQAGSARSIQVMAVDRNGNILQVPFHVSIYYDEAVKYPRSQGEASEAVSPFLPNHFQNIAPDGSQWGPNDNYVPDPSMIVGWGTEEQPAGYSPNRKTDGSDPTGLLIDESTWSWNMAQLRYGNFDGYWQEDEEDRKKRDRLNNKVEARSVWVHVYAEHTDDVYFIGRIYRFEPGT